MNKSVKSKFSVIHLLIALAIFTQSRGQVAPGGVSTDLALWLKSDAGVNCNTDDCDVTSWVNQEGTTSWDASGTGATKWKNNSTDLINFNPSLSFTDDDQPLQATNISRTNGTSSTIFITGEVSSIADNCFIEIGSYSSSRAFLIDQRYSDNTNFSTNITIDSPQVWSLTDIGENNATTIYETTAPIMSYSNKLFNSSWTSGATYTIGDDITGNNTLSGLLSEVIYYDTNLSAPSRARIDSYLAIKYGISINDGTGADYVSTSGFNYWGHIPNSGFNHDIFGIGRDDSTALNQKISKSENANTFLSIALDNDFTAPNTSTTRTSVFNNDLSYLMLGNNNGNLTVSSTALTGIHSNFYRINRIWKAQETGGVPCVKFQFDTSSLTATASQNWYVAIASDVNFTSNLDYKKIDIGVNAVVNLDLRDNESSFITLARIDTNDITDSSPPDGVIGIQTVNPKDYSYLDVRGGDKGFVVSRLNQTTINGLSPVAGMLVFNTSTSTFQLYNGTTWRDLNDPSAMRLPRFCN
jgi:hypothetical protein